MSTIFERTSTKVPFSLSRLFIGKPLATADAPHQTVGKLVGLAVFASDALSSTAYSNQEALIILIAAGTGALSYSIPIVFAIVALLAIVTLSYEQTIHAYPDGGGAYIVARDNLGELRRFDRGRCAADGLHPDRLSLGLFWRGANRLGLS